MIIKEHKNRSVKTLAAIALAAAVMAAPMAVLTASADDTNAGNDPDAGKVELVYGDADGDGQVTSNDALLCLRASLGLDDFTDIQKEVCDVDEDGNVTASDALLILRYSLGFDDNGIVSEHFKKYLK